MPPHRHLIIPDDAEPRDYTSTNRGGGTFRTPPRDDRVGHANRLLGQINAAREELEAQAAQAAHVIENIALEVVGPTRGLEIERLESLRRGLGIELRNVRDEDGHRSATIFVPRDRLATFVRKIEAYRDEDTPTRQRPKNEPLVAGIDEIRTPVLRSFWTDDSRLFPDDPNAPIWWEVWIQARAGDDTDAAFAEFVTALGETQLRVGPHALRFPERLVFHVHGTVSQWTAVFLPILDRLAEMRKAKEVASEFFRLEPRLQHDLVNDLAARLVAPVVNAPAVCILDHGVHRQHPLLTSFLRGEDAHTWHPEWEPVDPRQAHGTEVAGLAIFGDELASLLGNGHQPSVRHRLESVRILNTSHAHPEDTWGYVTQDGASRAEQAAPTRERLFLLPVTTNDRGRDHGFPTSWSAAIDQHSAGALDDNRRLYIVSAGNVQEATTDPRYAYPTANIETHRIEDPAQSWNALTVGACTDLIQIRDEHLAGFTTVAQAGELCPTSRTSVAWMDHRWPLKPDIVMEGGNLARSPTGAIQGCDDLTLLTTTVEPTGRLLTWTGDTSAASAQAARFAAVLMADYPDLWPETVRALLVHSAQWTPAMLQQVRGDRQLDRHLRLRCFGYGKPDLDRARYTVENRVALVCQGEIQPFKLVDGEAKSSEYRLHSLPWPADVLEALHDTLVTVRVTLSYFVEPSPGRRGWTRKFRYQSHGLRFAVRGPTETDDQFRRRVSRAEWEDDEERPTTADPIPWFLGPDLQTKGSLHSDWWSATGAEVARCGQVVVYPVTGWWRERKHLGCTEKRARYSLIITISTEDERVDLYTPIANAIGVQVDLGGE